MALPIAASSVTVDIEGFTTQQQFDEVMVSVVTDLEEYIAARPAPSLHIVTEDMALASSWNRIILRESGGGFTASGVQMSSYSALLPASKAGHEIVFAYDSGTNNAIIKAGSGDTIDGSASYSLSPREYLVLMWDGISEWVIMPGTM